MFDHSDYWERCFKDLKIEDYDFSRLKPERILDDFCKTYLSVGASVLDLGCGSGRNAHYLAQKGYSVSGIDISGAAIEFCQKRLHLSNLAGSFKQGTFDHIPFPDHYFAGVICVAAFDHVTVKSAQASMNEIRRVLISSGSILLTFDPPDTDDDRLDEAEILSDGTLNFVRGSQAGMLFHRYQDEEIKDLVGNHSIVTFKRSETGTRIVICR